MARLHDLTGDLDYPMFVVTAAAGEDRSGCLVGFAAQCSIHPPRLMVWLSEKNHTYGVALRVRTLAVHALASDQLALAELFGGETDDQVDKFTACGWRSGPDGVPVLTDCARWLAGTILDRLDTGDHVGFVLEPVEVQSGPWSGQLGYQAVHHIAPGHPA